jgi:hypothetical protein
VSRREDVTDHGRDDDINGALETNDARHRRQTFRGSA